MLLKTLKKEITRRLLGEMGIPKVLKRAKFILKHPQLAKTRCRLKIAILTFPFE